MFKGALSGPIQFSATENNLKIMTLTAHFVSKIFKLLS